jgi:hypothetical protein
MRPVIIPNLHLKPLDQYPDDLASWLRLFEAGHYRPALDPIENAWELDRNEFYRGLIKLTVGMNQVDTTELVSGPRDLLESARELLEAFEPEHMGIDVAAARRLAADALDELIKRQPSDS